MKAACDQFLNNRTLEKAKTCHLQSSNNRTAVCLNEWPQKSTSSSWYLTSDLLGPQVTETGQQIKPNQIQKSVFPLWLRLNQSKTMWPCFHPEMLHRGRRLAETTETRCWKPGGGGPHRPASLQPSELNGPKDWRSGSDWALLCENNPEHIAELKLGLIEPRDTCFIW